MVYCLQIFYMTHYLGFCYFFWVFWVFFFFLNIFCNLLKKLGRVYFLLLTKNHNLGFWYFGGSDFKLFYFYFLNFQNIFLIYFKSWRGIFYSNLSCDPLFRFLVFWGSFWGYLGLFLNFQNHFWNLLKKLGRVYFLLFGHMSHHLGRREVRERL